MQNSTKIKFALSVLIITLLTLCTVFIGLNRPALHKQVVITDSEYLFVEENSPAQTVKTSNISPKIQNNIKVKTVETDKKIVKKPEVKSTVKSNIKAAVKSTVKSAEKASVKQTVKPEHTAKSEIKSVQQPAPDVKKVKVLTESEEIIVWNHWRSELQNQVMRDTKIGAPIGTAFRFSFTVDKFGNMSNVKVWSTNPVYTDLAVRVIKPILLSYRNKPILNFPENTKRIITNVTGGFYISTTTEYSKPSDYSDYEKIKKIN